jgi:hypothetical protein
VRLAVPPARKVREYAQALGFLVFGALLILGFGWLAFIVVWAAIAESVMCAERKLRRRVAHLTVDERRSG